MRNLEMGGGQEAKKLCHMGIRSSVSRNNLSHANQTRGWRIYADFAQILIQKAKSHYASDDLPVVLDTFYSLQGAILKKRLGVDLPLYTALRIPSLSIFEKAPLAHPVVFAKPIDKKSEPACHNPLLLFE